MTAVEGNASVYQVYPVSRISGEGRAVYHVYTVSLTTSEERAECSRRRRGAKGS